MFPDDFEENKRNEPHAKRNVGMHQDNTLKKKSYRLKLTPNICLSLYHTIPTFNDPDKKAF